MKTAILSFVAGLAGACLLAATPDRPLPASAPLGGAIILDNEQLIEGEIRREGDRVIIRRGASETELPAARVVEIVADRKAAMQAMRDRTNRRDPDERLRLIRWCMENGLREEAIEEAEALLKSRPTDAKLKDLVQGLRDLGSTAAAKAADPTASPVTGKVVEVEPQDYNPESYGMFVSKVQPILMNVCIGCHSGDKATRFALMRTDGAASRNAAIHNLAATLKHLKRGNPQASPFLVKSIAAHGNAIRPPLRDRQHPAYVNLETWVNLAVVSEGEQPLPIKPMVEIRPQPKLPEPAIRFGESSKSKPLPEPQTEPKDPFDPAIFNGTIQPKKK